MKLIIMPQCRDSVKVYVTPPGGEFDFSNYYIAPNVVRYFWLKFKMQEFHVSPLLANCLSTEDAKKCKNNCINKRMMRKLKCRFPLMPEEYNMVPLCTSSTAAKEARATYIKILTTTDITKDCYCKRQCRKNIFESDVVIIPGKNRNNPKIVLLAHYVEANRQIFTESPSYTIIKLFCDIGGLLGLLLGFSFLGFMDILISVITHKA